MIKLKITLLAIFLVTFSYSQVSEIDQYKNILDALEINNTVLILEEERIDEDYYYESFMITEKQHKQRLRTYWNLIEDIYNLDRSFPYYLLSLKNNKFKIDRNSWVKTINPYRSDIWRFHSRIDEIRILIDHYLSGNQTKIKQPEYFDKISYRKLKRFLRKNRELNKSDLRAEYILWLKEL
ncbi:hypothetical protein G5B37_03405 [Rasiella rasia]|uniref:Uncharacterized protein n=1 Tax=Rasiella rasia TaxID=2744027 RepID=A0A6G6GJA8_9FLAO|nr:hypothetical protein [Rasiella rasia]QIE58639.1 hypothetical protein G5B37_03405 [Rasiella rasia]